MQSSKWGLCVCSGCVVRECVGAIPAYLSSNHVTWDDEVRYVLSPFLPCHSHISTLLRRSSPSSLILPPILSCHAVVERVPPQQHFHPTTTIQAKHLSHTKHSTRPSSVGIPHQNRRRWKCLPLYPTTNPAHCYQTFHLRNISIAPDILKLKATNYGSLITIF